MPSHLPVELLRLILDNFACPPISYNGTLENPHRHGLLSLCLTSKIFRQIVQPLLFAVIRLKEDEEDEEGTVRGLVKQFLDIGKRNRLLHNVRTLSLQGLDPDDTTMMSSRLLADLLKACTNLQHMISTYYVFEFKSLVGSQLRKLFVNDANFEEQDTSFCLPSLEILSLVDVYLPERGFGPANFPSLRHLAYDENEGELVAGTAETLTAFKSQVDSFVLVFDVVSELLGQDSTFPLHLVLVDYLRETLDKFVNASEQMTQARIRVNVSPGSEVITVKGVNEVSRAIETQAKCRQLEFIYLPPLDLLQIPTQPLDGRHAIDRLLLACQTRKIEIVHEEQPAEIKAETQFSQEFMRRMTKERIERASSNAK